MSLNHLFKSSVNRDNFDIYAKSLNSETMNISGNVEFSSDLKVDGNLDVDGDFEASNAVITNRDNVTLYDSSTISDVSLVNGPATGSGYDQIIFNIDGRSDPRQCNGGIIFGDFDENFGGSGGIGMFGKINGVGNSVNINTGGGLKFLVSPDGLTFNESMNILSNQTIEMSDDLTVDGNIIANQDVSINGILGLDSGSVGQNTNITTTVEANFQVFDIITQTATASAGGNHQFVLQNSFISSSSDVFVSIGDYNGTYSTNGIPVVSSEFQTPGNSLIIIANAHHANALNGTLIINVLVF